MTERDPSVSLVERPRVWNKRDVNVPKDAIYVGRPTKWGNPYVMVSEANRGDVVDLFRAYLEAYPQLKREAQTELRGKDLVCWCAPKACHADVLLEIAND